MAAIRSYLWYVADGEISMQSIALGASKVPFIKGTQKVKETIKPDDLAALLAAPSDRSKIGIRDKTILILLYDSAIRVSELRELTLESLKLNETIPYIRVHGKGDKERIVSITDKTVEHLKRYIKIYHSETNGDYPLFYTVIKGNLSAMSTGNVERILNKYAEKIRPDHPGHAFIDPVLNHRNTYFEIVGYFFSFHSIRSHGQSSFFCLWHHDFIKIESQIADIFQLDDDNTPV